MTTALRDRALETYVAKPDATVELAPLAEMITNWSDRVKLITQRAIEGAAARFAGTQEPSEVAVVSPGYIGSEGIVPVEIKLTYGDITVTAVRDLYCATSENPATWDFFYAGESFDNLNQLGEILAKNPVTEAE